LLPGQPRACGPACRGIRTEVRQPFARATWVASTPQQVLGVQNLDGCGAGHAINTRPTPLRLWGGGGGTNRPADLRT
jgi:hypothetical protein